MGSKKEKVVRNLIAIKDKPCQQHSTSKSIMYLCKKRGSSREAKLDRLGLNKWKAKQIIEYSESELKK